MDEEYDVIVLGTGLKECILSGLLSSKKKKVLHMDRNKYYGGESASITPLDDLYNHFKKEVPTNIQNGRSWNVDLVPKFIMANGKLVKLLIDSGVTRYLEFKSIEGSFVVRNDKVVKVPANEKEVLGSSLMGMFEKRRFYSFMKDIVKLDANPSELEKNKDVTMNEFFDRYKLDENTKDFCGHAMALYCDDSYLQRNCIETITKINLYINSIERFGVSPYLYPLYGLGELPQGFARLCAVHGGTYMLDKQIDEIITENGVFAGVRSGDEIARAKMVIGDPTYFHDKIKQVGEVARAICILSHPIANTNEAKSCQIILTQKQIGRKTDIYISLVSFSHNIADKGKFIAMVNTSCDKGADPQVELKRGVELLGAIDEIFYWTSPYMVPTDDGTKSNIFITSSYDATTHFETTCVELEALFEKITGDKFDFSAVKELQDESH